MNNFYCLDEDLRDTFRSIHKKKEEEKAKLMSRKSTTNERDNEKFRNAAIKLREGKELNVPDMRILMKMIPSLPQDSPLKTRQADSLQQFHRRRSRVCMYLDPLWSESSKSEENENNDESGLTFLSNVLFGEQDVDNTTSTITSTSITASAIANSTSTISNTTSSSNSTSSIVVGDIMAVIAAGTDAKSSKDPNPKVTI